ncbi:hypothetical protein [Rickettsia rhipicephali]|nr:hypothetical protein [Rickettsia rhipicephali]
MFIKQIYSMVVCFVTTLVRDYRRVPRNALVSSDRDDAVRVAYVGHVTF